MKWSLEVIWSYLLWSNFYYVSRIPFQINNLLVSWSNLLYLRVIFVNLYFKFYFQPVPRFSCTAIFQESMENRTPWSVMWVASTLLISPLNCWKMESLCLTPSRLTWPSKRAGSFTSPRAPPSHHRKVKITPAAFDTWARRGKLFGVSVMCVFLEDTSCVWFTWHSTCIKHLMFFPQRTTCKANKQRQTKGGKCYLVDYQLKKYSNTKFFFYH